MYNTWQRSRAHARCQPFDHGTDSSAVFRYQLKPAAELFRNGPQAAGVDILDNSVCFSNCQKMPVLQTHKVVLARGTNQSPVHNSCADSNCVFDVCQWQVFDVLTNYVQQSCFVASASIRKEG